MKYISLLKLPWNSVSQNCHQNRSQKILKILIKAHLRRHQPPHQILFHEEGFLARRIS